MAYELSNGTNYNTKDGILSGRKIPSSRNHVLKSDKGRDRISRFPEEGGVG